MNSSHIFVVIESKYVQPSEHPRKETVGPKLYILVISSKYDTTVPCVLYYVSAVKAENPDGFLLITDLDRDGLFKLNVTGGPQKAILLDLPFPTAVDYDPVHRNVFWNDYSRKRIGKYPWQNPNGISFFQFPSSKYV